jgi:hypothetical protein
MPTQLAARLSRCPDLWSILDYALHTGLELTQTSLGNIQLVDWTAGYLTIERNTASSANFWISSSA